MNRQLQLFTRLIQLITVIKIVYYLYCAVSYCFKLTLMGFACDGTETRSEVDELSAVTLACVPAIVTLVTDHFIVKANWYFAITISICNQYHSYFQYFISFDKSLLTLQ